jgi:hypothetical protein
MTRTSGITLQILGVAIFASSMFFFAMAVSRASSIDHGQQGPNNDKMQSEWPTAAETTDDSDYPLSLWALMQFATHGWQAAQVYESQAECVAADKKLVADFDPDNSPSANHLVTPNHQCVEYSKTRANKSE